jgi:hypothetical protein
MTTPTSWPARLVGDEILCGYGPATCHAVVAGVFGGMPWGGPCVVFASYYEPTPRPATGAPIALRFSTYAARQVARGQRPTGRHLKAKVIGAEEAVAAGTFRPVHGLYFPDDLAGVRSPESDRWYLPVAVPCARGHVSRVDRHTLAGWTPAP